MTDDRSVVRVVKTVSDITNNVHRAELSKLLFYPHTAAAAASISKLTQHQQRHK